jgi:hydrogenase large subunit
MSTRITIDPITRIEGHLRIDVEVDQGKVTKAWSSGQMWRGIELILQGRDPRDAWAITQRICGVCTTVHAMTSVRAVENALKLPVPKNAQYIRNIIMAAHAVHDHIVHFYHLAALDWVDIVSALSGDAAGAATLAESLSDYQGNSRVAMQAAKDRLTAFVQTGQLGIYASGYWGHPAMTLPAEANLMAAAHYLQALEVQRKANKIVAILGSKTPHIQNLTVGGVTNSINMDSQSTLTLEKLWAIRTLIDELGDFVHNAMMSDVAAVGALYAPWTAIGAGVMNYLCVPDMPLNEEGTEFALPGGWIPGGDLGAFRQIPSFNDPFFRDGVKESVAHSWYDYAGSDKALHPFDGQTNPNYTDFQDEGKYSWIKAPTFMGERAQVGPLANVLGMAAAGHEPTNRHLTKLLAQASAVAGTEIPLAAVHSTIGRIAARAVRCAVLHETLLAQWTLLMENIGSGDTRTFNRPEFPKEEIRGVGFHEAPRGTLSHWVVIEGGKIKNYQCVVPSTFNAGPRDDQGRPGPYEASLMDTPVADPELPLEVLRTVHSFDPCISCAIHMTDPENRPIVQVKAF